MDPKIVQAACDIRNAGHVIALTGAGMSVESGIPPFRGKGGLWEKIDPMEYAHIDAFVENPGKVWDVLIREMKTVVDAATPNKGHLGLAELEKRGALKTIITQNVDGLHQAAGSTDVIEFHGSFAWQRCMKCDGRVRTRDVDIARVPPLCACGGVYRPDCVFFGELIAPEHLSRSRREAAACDLMLVLGTSATVEPAASIPYLAKNGGARIIEINPEPTPLSGRLCDYRIPLSAGIALPLIIEAMDARYWEKTSHP